MAIAASNHRTVDSVAREAGMHPDLVRRYIAFGLIHEPFPIDAAARVAKAQRLRRDLALNLAGAVLAVELLHRIDDLEARLRRYER